MKTKVLQALKPKAASLGFSLSELEGVAATLAGNLTDDATEEVITSEIEKVLPFLKVSQSMANRVINAEKEKSEKKEPKGAEPKKDDDSEPAWFSKYKEDNDKRYADLLNVSVQKDRRKSFESKLEGLLPKQKEAKLKDFERINFKDDSDFDSYLTEQETVIQDIKQELADKGLEVIGTPSGGGKSISDEEEFLNLIKG